MFLENIQIIKFKNYNDLKLSFSSGLNCFLGLNGAGKTNFLDAIYYLSLFKSAFNHVDQQLIRYKEPFFKVEGVFKIEEKSFKIHASLKTGEKKSIRCNDIEYTKIAEHLGLFPVVMITPYDVDLIRDGSEDRRRFVDSIISQTDKEYLEHLMAYNHYLKQRNALIKQFFEKHSVDYAQIEPYNVRLISLAKKIYQKRNQFISVFEPIFQQYYTTLTLNNEKVTLHYSSSVAEIEYENLFLQNFEKDYHLQRTSMGIHTDDFEFKVNDFGLKKFGSQGQQKSYVISLKLAMFSYMQDKLQITPILLLDDIFDKLDEQRIRKLILITSKAPFKQLFITDARPERTKQILAELNITANYFYVENGEVNF